MNKIVKEEEIEEDIGKKRKWKRGGGRKERCEIEKEKDGKEKRKKEGNEKKDEEI